MPHKKYAIAGEPDFHNISDDKLKSYMDCVQQIIFAYSRFDDEKVKVLSEISKDLHREDLSRLVQSATEELEREEKGSPPLLRKVPKIRKSPAKTVT